MQHFLPQALNRAELSSENVWQSAILLPSDRRLASLIKHQPLKWEVMPECFEETREKKKKKHQPLLLSPPTAPGTLLTPHLLIKSYLATWHFFKCTMSFHHLNAFPCLSVYLIPYLSSKSHLHAAFFTSLANIALIRIHLSRHSNTTVFNTIISSTYSLISNTARTSQFCLLD